MMTISVIKSSAAAAKYFEKDDYYTGGGSGGGDTSGEWFGRGAEALGLSGGVDGKTFKTILDGHLPDGTDLGAKLPNGMKHRPGYDLTFSAPKSVSILAEVGGDSRIFEAHQLAVKEALGWIQDNAIAYRQRGFLGENVKYSDNLVAALFQHDTSRKHDPDLHTHAVLMNATQRGDGRWAALKSDPIYHAIAGGNIYRAALARDLQQLGYGIERTHVDGRFEVSSVPPKVLHHFSQRRQEIEAALKERGLDGRQASQAMALATRDNKKDIPRAELLPKWLADSRGLGFDAASEVRLAKAAAPRIVPLPDAAADRGLVDALDRLTEREATFTHSELVKWTLGAAMGQADLGTATRAVQRAAERGALKSAALREFPAWTTPKAKEQERRTLAAVGNGRGQWRPATTPASLQSALDAAALSEGQSDAVRLILTQPDQYVGVLGRPGTGKTYMLGVAREQLSVHGYEVRGLAQNGEAARTLAADSGIPSTTMKRHLMQLNRDFVNHLGGDLEKRSEIEARYAKQVWVVDEASQVPVSDMRRLVASADRFGARVVLVGDPKQLAAIEAGKPFAQMLENGLAHVEMDDIRRQRDPEHIKAIRAAVAGNVKHSMELLDTHVSEIPDRDERLQSLLDGWKHADDRSRTLMVTAGGQEKAALNNGAREILRSEGALDGEQSVQQLSRVFSGYADRKDAGFYEPGNIVRFERANKSLGIEKHEYLRVSESDRRTGLVLLKRYGTEDRTDDGTEDRTDDGPIAWRPRDTLGHAKRGVEVFRPVKNSIAPGETIRWTRNMKDLGLTNGQRVTVESIDDKSMSIRRGDGTPLTIDLTRPEGQHWDHAYATTIFSSQGQTFDRVLINGESDKGDLFSQKTFLVAISRHRDNLSLFVDDKTKFTDRVGRTLGDKTSAVEGQDQHRWGLFAHVLEAARDALFPAPAQQPERTPQDHGLSR